MKDEHNSCDHSDSSIDRILQRIERIFNPPIKSDLGQIKEQLKRILMTQEEFNAEVQDLNDTVTQLQSDAAATKAAVLAEAQQIADFIAANPTLDVSALAPAVANLKVAVGAEDSEASDVGGIFTPPSV